MPAFTGDYQCTPIAQSQHHTLKQEPKHVHKIQKNGVKLSITKAFGTLLIQHF